jgi:hypothetical protein
VTGLPSQDRSVTTPAYRYSVHGITIRSEIPLALPEEAHPDLTHVEVRTAHSAYFSDAVRGAQFEQPATSWYRHGRLPDRSAYIRWEGIGEFLVSADGSTIDCRRFDAASAECFEVYLLGQALSFALVQRGLEPLHATTIVINGEAAVFLGGSGFGKSSLAACFLDAGHRLLTDDLLVLQERSGRMFAYPGPPRIKLFPKLARRFLGGAARGTPMNSETDKLVLPLDRQRSCFAPVPIRTIYTLSSPRSSFPKQRIRFECLSPCAAFLELTKHTFNQRVMDSDRLRRQFIEAARLVSNSRIKKVFYPRVLSLLPAVRDAILSDYQRSEAAAFVD